ncbi:MAG TPA: ATP-binding protein [Terriglobia bacterium]|nr:ATP-binding protein [Terriglobia bacterium]
MTFRRSLRKKLVYTFLGGSLLTVLLFSIVIKGIMNDYFQRLGEVRLQFVSELGQREIRTNVAIFKDSFQDIFRSIKTTVGTLVTSGVIGDHLPQTPEERHEMARMLQRVQKEAKLSIFTIVDLEGRVILRATNPTLYGDETLMRDYEAPKPVSSIHRLLLNVLTGQTIESFETFAPEILAKENLRDQAKIQLKTWIRPAPANAFEERGLVMTIAMPLRTSSGKIIGAVLAGRLLNKDLEIVTDMQKLLEDSASIFLGDVRIAATATINRGDYKGQNATGTLLDADRDRVLSRGELLHFRTDSLMGLYEPLRNYENQVVGAIWIGRPLSFIDSIDKAQTEIETGAARRTNFYIVLSAVISLFVAVVIASFFSKRVAARIDQLGKGAEIIEKGRLDHRLRIDSGDEIELLSKQFNSMASKLQESYQTLEKKVEERTSELKKSQETMVQQEKMVGIGQLAAGIAHEMNTPLGTIIGYAQMLREDLTEKPGAANRDDIGEIDEIIGQAGRCRDLVKNLLNFSRRSTTEKARADINDIIRRILSLVDHDFEMKGVRIHTDLDANLPRTSVNDNEIAQVILNLANNAADSMPNGGELYISTNYNDLSDEIEIAVRDTGHGIKESDRNRVFEPFFTTKEVGKGTGLGLSISYKIVQNHSGSINFDSVMEQGTTFRVRLPANAEVRVG